VPAKKMVLALTSLIRSKFPRTSARSWASRDGPGAAHRGHPGAEHRLRLRDKPPACPGPQPSSHASPAGGAPDRRGDRWGADGSPDGERPAVLRLATGSRDPGKDDGRGAALHQGGIIINIFALDIERASSHSSSRLPASTAGGPSTLRSTSWAPMRWMISSVTTASKFHFPNKAFIRDFLVSICFSRQTPQQ